MHDTSFVYLISRNLRGVNGVAEELSQSWTFLSNHAHVIICLAADPKLRMRDVADMVGITERAVQRIVAELQEGNYLTVKKVGRRNHYEVTFDLPLRHPIEAHRTVRNLVELGEQPATAEAKKRKT